MTTLIARLKAAAEDAQRWDTPGAEHELAELLSPSSVLTIVAALEAAQALVNIENGHALHDLAVALAALEEE